MQASVSLKRLQKFLDNDELDSEAVEHRNSESQLYGSCVGEKEKERESVCVCKWLTFTSPRKEKHDNAMSIPSGPTSVTKLNQAGSLFCCTNFLSSVGRALTLFPRFL